MLLIYTHIITERLRYTLDIVFEKALQTSFQLTTDLEEFNKSRYPKLAYTKSNNGFNLFIHSDDLLFETSIYALLPEADKHFIDFPQFFKSAKPDFLGYDVFAMVFYFSTRYEEYLNTEKDEHQRFKAEHSIAYHYGCLKIPFLNNAINQFGEKLKENFPELQFAKRNFNYLSTIDIDNAFAYANKGLMRNAGGFFKDILSLKPAHIVKRTISNLNQEKDPYNTFQSIHSLSKETQTALHYFVLIGDHSKYDKNPDYRNNHFRKLLKNLSADYSMGLHPSYESFNRPEKMEMEKKRLEAIIEKKITSARCHFLRVKFPETYRVFIENGITDDYTMIYASQSGFRTGLCMPFPWFDLANNKQTTLMIHPSTVMEGTLRDYNKYSPQKAMEEIYQLMDQTKKYGGEFVSVWHNDSFVVSQEQWITVYKKLLMNSKPETPLFKSHNS